MPSEVKPHSMRVTIVGPDRRGDAKVMLLNHPRIKFTQAPSVVQSDMILYTGGEDVSPDLYGDVKLPVTHNNVSRDLAELNIFREARKHNIFQVGFCRGSQFLNVMCGGRMWQDVNNHAVGLTGHLVTDFTADISSMAVHVGSWHHQQAILGKGAQLLAEAKESTHKINGFEEWNKGENGWGKNTDVEAFYYPEHRCLGVQWHPEWGPKESTDLFFKYIDMYRGAACG